QKPSGEIQVLLGEALDDVKPEGRSNYGKLYLAENDTNPWSIIESDWSTLSQRSFPVQLVTSASGNCIAVLSTFDSEYPGIWGAAVDTGIEKPAQRLDAGDINFGELHPQGFFFRADGSSCGLFRTGFLSTSSYYFFE